MSGPEPVAPGFIRHPLLLAAELDHGFGTCASSPPEGLSRPLQVHGVRVAQVLAPGRLDVEEADAAISAVPGAGVGIVSAVCVPFLLATSSGRAVGAIHAGWRGLAAGVVERGVAALAACAAGADRLLAVIGPRIGPCCYEVDSPVTGALRERFGKEVDRAGHPSRPGHVYLDLGWLVAEALTRGGVAPEDLAAVDNACTACDPARFHSYRRDGDSAGRLLHYIVPKR